MTITFTPPTYAAIHFDLNYVIIDATKAADGVTYPNYKYIADIYINGTFQARLKRFPNPDNLYGVFNIAPIIRNYISVKFNPGSGLIAQYLASGDFYLDVQVKFGEEYNYTEYFNVLSDSSRRFYNYYNKRLVNGTAQLSSHVDTLVSNSSLTLNDASSSSVLKRTSHEMLFETQFYFLTYFSSTTAPYNFSVATNEGNTYTATITPTVGSSLMVFNIAPSVLNALHAGLITDDTKYFNVQFNTTIFTVRMVCEEIFQPYSVHFLNQFGGFETKIFTKLSRSNLQYDRKAFSTTPYNVTNTGTISYLNGTSVYADDEFTYAVQWNEKFIINSDYLSDDDYVWLEDLVASPITYLEIDSLLYPVTITDTNYEPKKYKNDLTINTLSLTLSFGRTFNAQFR